MARKLSRNSKVLISIFGPIAVLFVVLVIFQYKTFKVNRQRIEEQLTRQQDLITTLAANRMQDHVKEVSLKLDQLAGVLSVSRGLSTRFEEVGKAFDALQDRVDGIAVFDASGRKVHSISKNGVLSDLPNDCRFEEFFSVPKQTQVPYLSPLTKLPGGGEEVFISRPVRTADTGAFAGVVLAQVSRASFSSVCDDMEKIGSGIRLCYYDQRGQKLCQQKFCDLGIGPQHKDMMTGGVTAVMLDGQKDGASRLLFNPVRMEGYSWYVSSVMPMSGMAEMAKSDFWFLLFMGVFFVLSLAGGGLYFMKVYKAKFQAEAEAAHQTSLAEEREATAAEKDKLLAVLNSIPDGIMLMDNEGRILDANAKVRDILGVSPKGRLAEDLDNMPDDFPIKSLMGPIGDGGERVIGNKTYKLVSIPVSDAGQGQLREVRLLRDITLEKSLAQKKSDLVSMITHDVKSPLTAIIGISQWISHESMDAKLDEDVRAGLDAVGRAAGRILSIMENFLFLTSLEGTHKIKKSPVSLNTFLNKAIIEFYLDAKQKNIKFNHRIAEPSPVVPMDENQMMRALANLISNALKYTPAGGEVSVFAKNFRNYVTVSVSDTGPGISKTDIPFIFDRYYRAQSAKKGAKGSGLGLAIAKAIVEAHGGTIDVVSEEGHGSTFTLRLPLYNASEIN